MRDRDDSDLASAVGDQDRRPPAGGRRGLLDFVKLELKIFLAAVVLGLVFVVVIVVVAIS